MDEDILSVDVTDEFGNKECDVGEDGLQVYIVAPARITHHTDANNKPLNWPSYVNRDRAHTEARLKAAKYRIDMCVYRVETLSRFNYKGIDSVA